MSSHLQIEQLSFTYPQSSVPVFEHLSLQLYSGWTGIVGANGSGKSTLLQLICAVLKPQSGIIRHNADAYYCQQRTDAMPDAFETLMNACDAVAYRLKDALQIEEAWSGRWERLSHGERKRAQVAAALYRDPPLLALDEPTNHLDEASKALLFGALKAYRGIGLLISHDREFLDGLCRHTLFCEAGSVDVRRGGYSMAKTERDKERAHCRAQHEQQSREIKKLKAQVSMQRRKADRSDRRLSKRHLDPKDIDAKKKIELAALTGKDAIEGRTLQRYQSRLVQAQAKLGEIGRTFVTGIAFESATHRKLFPVSIEAHELHVGSHGCIHIPRLSIGAGEKIGITGINGSGKSSFIRHLLATHAWSSQEVLYIPQEIDLEASAALMRRIHESSDETKGELMNIIRRLGSDPSVLLQSRIPSPGETRKLMLALGIAERPGMIILDEPTNHLDIVAIECVEQALQTYEGALLVVSHDRAFLARTVVDEWHFEKEGEVVRIATHALEPR